ncbi:phosphoglycerate dehydrogenase [Cellulomonas sp. DKR-3]|uniref:Phosphoglycerate dehydrogenase n=1 Tax=Cellulomonas fulva TaxID=2835530 RepID=A0ABS5TZZ6_9CELL|nr:NAD(P)-dependent oxidoreductase [Cellulomonas fulva]MBT0994677.1 phosphoglycerate dehydrogenase [Cellulomonas fulva]
MRTILLPTTLEDPVELPDGWRAVPYDPQLPLPDDTAGAEVLVVWGNRRAALAQAAAELTDLRWVACLAAGTDAVVDAGFPPTVTVTSGRGLHDATVAEHTLALVLACARRLPDLVRAQDERRWAGELGGLQPVHDTSFRSLADAHVVVWGFGSIAARLAPLLAALGARVTGVATSAGERHGFPVVTPDELPSVLPGADVLVGILPATASTQHAIGRDVLRALPAHAFVVNVGRGSTLDEAALLDAVRTRHLAGAALDVFEREPLPPSSPLWGEPSVLISPHAAGGRPRGAGAFLGAALRAYDAGDELPNVVPR